MHTCVYIYAHLVVLLPEKHSRTFDNLVEIGAYVSYSRTCDNLVEIGSELEEEARWHWLPISYVSIRQNKSADVSIHQHTSAYVSIL